MAQNRIEKIAQRFAVNIEKKEIHSGDYVVIKPAHVLTHDNTAAVIPKFMSIGAEKMADSRQPVFALDHNVQDKSEENLNKYKMIENFAQRMKVDFYPAGRGIGHQIMCEEGYAWPGTVVVASDSHANMYGGLGCLGTPIVRSDAASIWATGETWWQVPPVAKVELKGQLKKGVTGKDVIITLCGVFNKDETLNYAIEFCGEGVYDLSIDQRLTIANMTTEWGALAGVFPVDEITIKWLKNRCKFVVHNDLSLPASDVYHKAKHPRISEERIRHLRSELNNLKADSDAYYSKEIVLDLSTLQPQVCGPNSVKINSPLSEISKKNIKINKAYLLSCVNGRVEDFAEAAAIVRGKKIANGVKFYISAASSEVQQASEHCGDWQTLLEAGAISLPPGCGPCIGLGAGLLQNGEIGISATNRNFKGRMGSKTATTYLASPVVVAAAALVGKIIYPGVGYQEETQVNFKIYDKSKTKKDDALTEILTDFPSELEGEMIFCYQDNLNTDGIYPGKYTYLDDFTEEQQARVVMENYDPDFGNIVERSDILVGGFNFASGSSREQAATAFKYKGIQLILAGSFSETYKRNALNNGLLVIEAPDLVDYLKNKFGERKLTVRTGIKAKLDFVNSKIYADGQIHTINPIGVVAQELIVAGGLIKWVQKKLRR
jgi:homoaconitate hydratase